MKRATEAEVPEIAAFLSGRADRAMFPLSNLDRHGLDGDHSHAPRIWVQRKDGRIVGLLTQTKGGVVMPASTPPEVAAAMLAGRPIAGAIGPADEVRPLLNRLGLAGRPARVDRDEAHFALDLADLAIPAGDTCLGPLGAAPRALMESWRDAANQEALGEDPVLAAETARTDVAAWIESDTHRVLWQGDTPVAMTGFNASLPSIVQVGAVYTPSALRGRGHARRAVALHLAEARAAGVARATLFTASPAAACAYRAIGFRRIGLFTLCLFEEPAHG